jgi:large subunit ribosomal protein L10
VIEMTHVSESKKKTVDEFVNLINQYPVIGVVNMSNLPTKQLQSMRSKLRAKNAVLRMTKKRLMKIAFSKSSKANLKELESHFKGLPALVFTKENPFKIYSELQKTKSKAPAKPGQEAPRDIIVQAGPTSFTPGPVIGQLGKFGIKTGVEGGKIVIKQDSRVAKKGDIITAELAGILQRLNVEPMEIGLDMTAAYEDGIIFTSDVLFVDEKDYLNKICTAYTETINLSVYIAYPSSDTISILLGKAFRDAKAVAVSQDILTPETTADILLKAQAELISLSNSLPTEAQPEELRFSVKAESQKPDKDLKQEPEKKDEPQDTAAGLGTLFG